MLARVILWLGGLTFGAFGVLFLVSPRIIETAGIALPGVTGSVEVRAMYGGLEIALAAFLIMAAERQTWRNPGLALQTLAFGGLALGRSLGFGLAPGADTFMLKLLAAEIFAFGLSFWALKSSSRT